MNGLLNHIIAFADEAHGEQTRKYTPDRYIVHPVRVMKLCREHTSDPSVLAAALLHDVLEDTPTSEEDIRAFLSKLMLPPVVNKTLQLVKELTDVYTKENYPQWNRHKRRSMEAARLAKASAEAQTIKYADILDNSGEIIPYDLDFALRFLKECKAILLLADQGNRELRKRAFDIVNTGLEEVNKTGRSR